MADWNTIAADNFDAANVLGEAGHYRSRASRSYYAAFSAVSHCLKARGAFSGVRETPPHHRVVALIEDTLAADRLPIDRVRKIKVMLRRLYNNRINADYKSGVTVDEAVARESRLDSHAVLRLLGAAS